MGEFIILDVVVIIIFIVFDLLCDVYLIELMICFGC